MVSEGRAVVFSVEAVVLVVIVVGSVLIVVVVDVEVALVGFSSLVVESMLGSLGKIVNRTNANIPRPRSVQTTTRTELRLRLHLTCFRVDTRCPSLAGLTG